MKDNKTKSSRVPAIILIILLGCLALMILIQLATLLFGPSKSECKGQACLQVYLEGPPAFNSPFMVKHLQDRYFHSSSSSQYNLSGFTGEDGATNDIMNSILKYFKNKKNGNFVVLGAGDGEYKDYSLKLEKEFGWTGLLVEPNEVLFDMLKRKGRKSQLANLCISPFPYSMQVKFAHPKVRDSESDQSKLLKLREGKPAQLFGEDEMTEMETFSHQCIPLENVVYAAGYTEVIDLLILDMSTADLAICSFIKMEQLPKIKMIVVISNGTDLTEEIRYYFSDLNVVLYQVMGSMAGYHVYTLVTPVIKDTL